ncbi:hypothetical protein [Demequina sp.]|uniref:AMIN-like domain-containing (lipo)protein n=1 Tax=Demequina sp. TaxID=2050685 RepID=UPI0025CDBA6A|nr:hypothetical protein [Demequina sp.]
MRTGRRLLVAVVAAAALLSGCTSTGEPDQSASPTATATASPAATAATATPTPTPTTSPTAATCEPFGTLDASTSSDDWSAQLRTGAGGDALWGVTMRVGTHECYDRWVFEFDGPADMPGWSVTPHASSTFLGDPSGEPIAPPLAGTVSLDVMFAAWYDGTAIEQPTYAGPQQILTTDAPAIQEARIVSGFEGISQVGIGLDAARPYRVTWLTDPGRLVIDVYTGES